MQKELGFVKNHQQPRRDDHIHPCLEDGLLSSNGGRVKKDLALPELPQKVEPEEEVEQDFHKMASVIPRHMLGP